MLSGYRATDTQITAYLGAADRLTEFSHRLGDLPAKASRNSAPMLSSAALSGGDDGAQAVEVVDQSRGEVNRKF